ncbi:MAG: alpha-galactosidase [Eubacteriales bacterium]|nr:alpha-galactosidase [Eubacteriales bacterium]
MSIYFDEQSKIFSLGTRNSTYQMKVDDGGFVRHLYYGANIGHCDMSYLVWNYDRGFAVNPHDEVQERTYSLSIMAQEYTSSGIGDFRINSIDAVGRDGSGCIELRYAGHSVLSSKYEIPDMPSVRGEYSDVQTLVLKLRDKALGLDVHLYYGVFEQLDVITRSVRIINRSDSDITLYKAASCCLDLPYGQWDMIHFYGRHCMERQEERVPVMHACQSFASKRGMSSHHHNPFVILCDHEATEDYGSCYGVMLMYSGNHKTEIEMDETGCVRVLSGINEDHFRWTLGSGETFCTPESILTFSEKGLTGLSHNLHRVIRENVIPAKYSKAVRPVLINNWEATYFNFDEEKILKLADKAAKLGIELFVLDDGWFGVRNSDHTGLGDWYVNTDKLPSGLKGLSEAIHKKGMKFGLWIEPEMISEDSDLYREHPDWVLKVPGRAPALGRDQLVLDMSRGEVVDYLFDRLSDIIGSSGIDYIKWDMNRPLSDVYSCVLSAERQGEVGHRYVLGVYDLMGRLTSRFPDVLFEGCAGGGGRFDAGILYYSPQIWCSDDTDPIHRLKIQRGTSYGYPVSSMGAHVSASPNHQSGRSTPLNTRGIVAMSGTFGYELDLGRLKKRECDEIRDQIREFHKNYFLIQNGLYYRLNREENYFDAWEFVAEDGSEALLNVVVTNPIPTNGRQVYVRLKGLIPDARYKITADMRRVVTGEALMKGGYAMPQLHGDYPSMQVHFIRVE